MNFTHHGLLASILGKKMPTNLGAVHGDKIGSFVFDLRQYGLFALAFNKETTASL
jgi:hypothetical protein